MDEPSRIGCEWPTDVVKVNDRKNAVFFVPRCYPGNYASIGHFKIDEEGMLLKYMMYGYC